MLTTQPSIEFRNAFADDWFIIHTIAHKTWPVTYGELISTRQLNYMLSLIYSESSIREQIEVMKHVFSIGYHSGMPFGFVSIEEHYKKYKQLMIHKLYVLPALQGKGFGKAFINYTNALARDTGHEVLYLKVFNKNQKGIMFYESMGFTIYGEEKTDLGNGYEILDYIMIKKIGG